MRGYAGEFGSGKTLNMTKDLYEAYQTGNAFIITNYSTVFSHLVCYKRKDFLRLIVEIFVARDQKKKLFGEYEWIFIGIDEGGIYFNSHQWKYLRAEFEELGNDMDDLEFTPDAFFLQLRKMKVQIFYTVQQPSLMDVSFRKVTTDWCISTWFTPQRLRPYVPVGINRYGSIPFESSYVKNMEATSSGFVWRGEQLAWQLYNTEELVKYIELHGFDIEYKILSKAKTIDWEEPSFLKLNFPTLPRLYDSLRKKRISV